MPTLALVDANNFFVSCERLFRPDLEGRPVVVLSSNDGCVVSRSNEAKDLGIPMGAPAFKYRQQFRQQGVVQFSANFNLYGDISQRLTLVLAELTPQIEVYSVDESFLDLTSLGLADPTVWARRARQRLLDEVGIPVSIGIAPTKTLAKLATEQVKRQRLAEGIFDLASLDEAARLPALIQTPLRDIWGIGWRLAPRLQAEGLHTAADLAAIRPQLAEQLMGVHGRRLVAELNGICCQPLERVGKVRQTIMHGRMFGEDTNQFAVVEAAIASLTARAAAGLRREGLLANRAVVHLSTNRHKPGYQRLSRTLNFSRPTADTGQLISELVAATGTGFNPRTSYHRVNVLLYDLINAERWQAELFAPSEPMATAQARMTAVDGLNARYGPNTVRYAAEELSQAWQPKRGHRSPNYVSDWDELPVLHA
jgi:DNA polymerase V